MSEFTTNLKIKQGSEKSFGIVFSIIFLIIALYPAVELLEFQIFSAAVSIIFLLFAFLAPRVLIVPNKLWFKFGVFLGSIIAPIVMTLIYFVTILPVGLIMRLLGKDLLRKEIDKNSKSYWIRRIDPVGSMKNQF